MATLKIILRRTRTLLWTAFSILVILAAALVGVGKLLMPYSDRYQPRLEAWLSEEFGRPVELESFRGEWTAFGPRLTLQGMTLMAAGPSGPGGLEDRIEEVAIESAALDIRPLNSLLPGRPLYNFRIIGADFELRHTPDGRFELSGFGVSRRGSGQGSALTELARVGEVVLEDSSLVYQDEKYGILLGFAGIGGRLQLAGNEMSAEVHARFHDERSELVYGSIDATLLMTLDDDQKMTEIGWHASASDLMLAAFQGRVPKNPFLPLTGWLNAELWGEWSRAGGLQVRGVTNLGEARLVNDYQDLRLDRVNARFRWHFNGRGQWDLHLADFHYDDGVAPWTAPRISIARDIPAGMGLWIGADELPLGVPLNLARDVMSIYDTAWPAFLPRAADGEVSGLDLVLGDDWRLELARGTVRRASVSEWDRWPDLSGLDGEVRLRRGSGQLRLRGQEVRADWPRMFRQPLAFGMPGCDLDLRWGGRWQVRFSDCGLENEDLAAVGQVTISGDEGKPDVDINVAVTRGGVGRLDAYWPESIMKDNVKAWLRKGLLGGEIDTGRLQIRGDMDDWPFREGRGRFEAVAEVSQARIDYFDGWPQAGGVDAVARFLGAAMDIRGTVGDIGGLAADRIHARIDELKAPVLILDYETASELPKLLDFLQQTPLREQVRVDLSQFEFRGDAGTEGRLKVPLGAATGELSLDGRVSIPAGHFSYPEMDIALEAIEGVLRYDERGFEGSGLRTTFRDHPARLDLAAGMDREDKFRADLEGIFDVRDVIPGFLLESYQDLAQVGGECLWQVGLTTGSGADDPVMLQVESQLAGVDLDLPAPLNKPAGEAWPLMLRFPLSGPGRLLDIEFLGRTTMRFDLSGETEAPLAAVIRLGDGLPDLPPNGFVRIEGEADRIDLDGWLDVIIDGALQGRGMGGLDLEKGEISAATLRFLDRHFNDVAMAFSVIDPDVRAEFSGEGIEGNVRYTTGETGMNSLTAEFERLALGDPLTSGVDMETDPADLPALHLYAKSFLYAGVELGETRIEAYPTARGFHFEKVDASSDQISVQASGDWLLGEGGQRSDFNIHMASESLGDFLQSLDISSSVQGGQTLVDFTAWWPGSPAAFALSRLNGEVDFSVVDGNITNASAGTGRLLGLLSFQALPRRLSLDFRDVFDSGFSFESASGTFVMENGMASTDDVVLESSAAKISVSGSTDLVNQRYDQVLTIRPGIGNTLPLIGALAAGPGGAAAGLALQGLLQDELAEATRVQYAITGPWDDPVFEAVDVTRAEEETPRMSK